MLLATLLAALGAADPSALTLEAALARARASNFDLAIARERLARSSSLTGKAWAALLPRLSGQVGGTLYDKEVPFGQVVLQRQTRADAQADLSWTLFNGQLYPSLLNAYAAAELESLSYQEREEVLFAATELAYYNALAAAEQIHGSRRALTGAERALRLAEARAETGLAVELEVVRARVEVATRRQEIIQSENAGRLAQLALGALLGDLPLDGASPAYRLERPPAAGSPGPRGDDLLAAAAQSRLDLARLRLQQTMAQRQVWRSRLRILPTLQGGGTLAWSDVAGFAALGEEGEGDQTTWRLWLNAQWPLFEGGLKLWERRELEHDVAAAGFEFERTHLHATHEIRRALKNLETATAALALAGQRVELARKTAELVRAQYEQGLGIQFDLLEAERSLADAETSATLAQLEADVARLTVERSGRVSAPQP